MTKILKQLCRMGRRLVISGIKKMHNKLKNLEYRIRLQIALFIYGYDIRKKDVGNAIKRLRNRHAKIYWRDSIYTENRKEGILFHWFWWMTKEGREYHKIAFNDIEKRNRLK